MDSQVKLKDVSEFWLISVPGEKPWDAFSSAMSKEKNLSANFKFNIPELKVGTLDILVRLSGDLGRLDTYVESVIRRLTHTMEIVLEKDKWRESQTVNGSTTYSYLTKFQWDSTKFPTRQHLQNIVDQISKEVTQIDADMRTKFNSYNFLKTSLQTLQKKNTGSLLTRGLAELVSKDDFVLDSEYLVTLLVVFRKQATDEWLAKYETLTDMVVPRSSSKIAEGKENFLFNVTVFRKVADDFKAKCVKNKFTVREFVYNEEEVTAERNEIARLSEELQKQFVPLVKWLQVNFGDAFLCWTHVKALRVFVESVLRFGLPVKFQAILLAPPKNNQKKLRQVLHKLYSHLDNKVTGARKVEVIDIPGLNISAADHYPYVFFNICPDACEVKKKFQV